MKSQVQHNDPDGRAAAGGGAGEQPHARSSGRGVRPPAAPRVLLAEDESMIALPLQLLLESAGYQVIDTVATASGVMHALAAAQASTGLPDVVLMDISLKGPADGIEAARQVKSRYADNVAVIFLTGRTENGMRSRAEAAEADGYLLKPCTLTQINAAIRAIFARRNAASPADGQ